MLSADTTDLEARYRNGEAGLELIAIALLRREDVITEDMGWPAVKAMHRQKRISNQIADIVLEHADRSVTIIEVKRGGLSLRDYCTGIGQLAYQAMMAIPQFQTFDVRRVLALPGPVPIDVVLLCEAASVDILPLPTADQWCAALREAACQP